MVYFKKTAMETYVDDKPAMISDSRIRAGIFAVGSLCGLSYIVFFLIMKALNLVHITELRVFNYVVLVAATFFMLRKWVMESHHYIPFLKVVGAAFFTGLWSFILFSVFLIIYTHFDYELYNLFLLKTHGTFDTWPEFVVLFEGAGASIVTAFFMMQYFRRYEDGHPFPEQQPGRR
jgi:hypothetical protein